MSIPKHQSCVDSGVQWVGRIPTHWKICRARRLFEIKKRIVGELGFDVLSITQTGIRVKDTESNDGQVSMDYSKYQLVEPGDFAMNHMDLLTGFVDIASQPGVTSPDYRVFSLREPSNAHSKYMLYLFQNGYINRIFYAFGQGSSQFGRWRMPTDQFNELQLPLPPLQEQILIAGFLDSETSKIDALVDEQRRLIELLKEKRQAVISRAVSRGLDPQVPMKESGAEWLGKVPQHWVVGAVKRFFQSLDGRRIPLSSEERGSMGGEYPYYGASGVIDSIDRYIFEEDLVLVSEDGANLINRSTPIAFVARGKYWVNNHAHILKPFDDNRIFWSERIELLDLVPFVTGAAQPKLTADALFNLLIAVPPSEAERSAIERHIISVRQMFDPLVAEAEEAISLLQERRSALISAAVTGKIDVRSWRKQEELEPA